MAHHLNGHCCPFFDSNRQTPKAGKGSDKYDGKHLEKCRMMEEAKREQLLIHFHVLFRFSRARK
jgi:hypothetical protein